MAQRRQSVAISPVRLVIDYGNRWGNDSPPEDTYSFDPHPQRFAPIHTIGEALIAHLSGGELVTPTG